MVIKGHNYRKGKRKSVTGPVSLAALPGQLKHHQQQSVTLTVAVGGNGLIMDDVL